MRPFGFLFPQFVFSAISRHLLLICLIKFIEYLLHGYPAVSGNQKEYRIVITRQVVHRHALFNIAVRNL